MSKIIAMGLLRAGIASAILTHASHHFDAYMLLILALILLFKTVVKLNEKEDPKIISILSWVLLIFYCLWCILDLMESENTSKKEILKCIGEIFSFWALDVLFEEFLAIRVFKSREKSDNWVYNFIEGAIIKFFNIKDKNNDNNQSNSNKSKNFYQRRPREKHFTK